MFTGLVREIGTLRAVQRRDGLTRLAVAAPRCAPGLAVGDSLAVNGVCLTVTARAGELVTVEATAETRRVSTLAGWRGGDRVHLEPALRVGDALGGHFVLGHVDGVGRIATLARRREAVWMTVVLPRALAARLLPKGSIAVDGVSLTLDEGPFADRFTVTLIPHTLGATRFGGARAGERVNLELDILAKAAAAAPVWQAPQDAATARPRLTLAWLRARGFARGGTR